jgi:hypothetical protein
VFEFAEKFSASHFATNLILRLRRRRFRHLLKSH